MSEDCLGRSAAELVSQALDLERIGRCLGQREKELFGGHRDRVEVDVGHLHSRAHGLDGPDRADICRFQQASEIDPSVVFFVLRLHVY